MAVDGRGIIWRSGLVTRRVAVGNFTRRPDVAARGITGRTVAIARGITGRTVAIARGITRRTVVVTRGITRRTDAVTHSAARRTDVIIRRTVRHTTAVRRRTVRHPITVVRGPVAVDRGGPEREIAAVLGGGDTDEAGALLQGLGAQLLPGRARTRGTERGRDLRGVQRPVDHPLEGRADHWRRLVGLLHADPPIGDNGPVDTDRPGGRAKPYNM
ncbi:hypothetical protein [Streptomyces sp. NPDC004008]